MAEMRKAFHDELAEVTASVARLGGLAREAIRGGTLAFVQARLDIAESVLRADRDMDELAHSLESGTCLLIARQQPLAADLRLLLGVLRVIHDLERIGDNMVNVAKAARRLYPYRLETRISRLVEGMGRQATAQLDLAMASFTERDAAKGAALRDMDDGMDELQKDLFRVIIPAFGGEEKAVNQAVQVALVGRYFERVGDLCVDVGERVRYVVTGRFDFEGTEDAPPG